MAERFERTIPIAVDDVRVRTYNASARAEGPALIRMHGGSWTTFSIELRFHRDCCGR